MHRQIEARCTTCSTNLSVHMFHGEKHVTIAFVSCECPVKRIVLYDIVEDLINGVEQDRAEGVLVWDQAGRFQNTDQKSEEENETTEKLS